MAGPERFQGRTRKAAWRTKAWPGRAPGSQKGRPHPAIRPRFPPASAIAQKNSPSISRAPAGSFVQTLPKLSLRTSDAGPGDPHGAETKPPNGEVAKAPSVEAGRAEAVPRKKAAATRRMRPRSWDGTSRTNQEVHVRICGRLGVKFPGPTWPALPTSAIDKVAVS
jgi:hypothetical protein